jgi:Domain of unknown function (DUF4249)
MLFCICMGCREYYEPPALINNPGFLVVDGFLNNSPDSTYITLTRTRNLRDTAPASPELNSTVLVEGDQYTHIVLSPVGAGLYGSLLPLNTAEKYRLIINTSDNRQYQSDFVPFKQTPAIDSLTWEENNLNVKFFLNTHDPQNNSVYYRLQFTETWQYDSYLVSNFYYENDSVFRRTPDQQIHHCWKTRISPTILLFSTNRLSQDIVSHFPFNYVSKSTEKIDVLYSLLMNQYALTRDEFDDWTNLKKNSE